MVVPFLAVSSLVLADYSQLSGITAGGTTYDLVHTGTDNSERTKMGPTWLHHTALSLASTTTNGVDTGFIREPAGTLNSMTTGGKSYCYLTDATGNVFRLVDDTGKRTHTYAYGPTDLYKMGARYYDPTLGRFSQPDPSGQETNRYLYAAGDPVNNSDPAGTSVLGCVAGGFSVVGGALSFGAGVASAFGSGGLSTPASLAAMGGGLGFIGSGLAMIDSCMS